MNLSYENIAEQLKAKVKIEYQEKVFTEGKEIKPEWMIEPQKPESLIDQLFISLIKNLDIPKNKIISQSKIKLYAIFKKKRRYPDYKLTKNPRSEKNILIELEPFNSDIEIGINQALEWIQDIRIGSMNDALVTNLNSFFLISYRNNEIKKKELSFQEFCKYITNLTLGKKVSVDLDEISRITERFYDQFYALIHGGVYKNKDGETIKISEELAIIKNLLYDKDLTEDERVQYIHTVFNRLIFIKILIDWDLFPNIFSYFKNIPSDLQHILNTELDKLFFKTLAVIKENRINLPEIFEKVPFLNGGLFRRTELEENNPDLTIKPPYILMILEFLEDYSFVKEGDGDSTIDSEILGYIFEKTIEFRKGTGSFYTHKYICDFMCENILYPHLTDRINDYLQSFVFIRKDLEKFLQRFDFFSEKRLDVLKVLKAWYDDEIDKDIAIKKLEKIDCNVNKSSQIFDFIDSIRYRENELLDNFEETFILREKIILDIYEKIIKNLKICDICVGSGAFLLAMGDLLLNLHKRFLDFLHKDYNEIKIKQYIVEYNLFGVDIEVSAIQICQLRMWLWISENSKEIKPLPNIEYNLRVGNSLLGLDSDFEIGKVSFEYLQKLENANILNGDNPKHENILTALKSGVISFSILKRLKKTLLEIYMPSHSEKTNKIRKLIEELNDLIIEHANSIYYKHIQERIGSKKFLSNYSEQEKSEILKDFLKEEKVFYWQLEFPLVFPKGFDIIVGNPPYISTKYMQKIPLEQDIRKFKKKVKRKKRRIKKLKTQDTIDRYKDEIEDLNKKIKHKEELLKKKKYQKKKLYNQIYKEYLKNEFYWAYKIYDILIPFYERGFNLLNDNDSSYLSFITSNKFLANDYGERIRKDLLNDYKIELIVDISMIRVFKDAAVYPIISSIKKTENNINNEIIISRYDNIGDLGRDTYYVPQKRYNREKTNYLIYIPNYIKSFRLFDKIEDEVSFVRFEEVFKTHYRVFDFTNWGDFRIFIKDTKGNKLGEDYNYFVDLSDLNPFHLEKENQKYFHKNIPSSKNPKNLQIKNEIWELFNEKMLLIKEVSKDLICSLAENHVHISKMYGLTVKEDSKLKNLAIYYFLGLLNSKLLDFYFRVVFWNTHLSGGYLNFHGSYLDILPILDIDNSREVYLYIVLLSMFLHKNYLKLPSDLLDLLVLEAYFPDTFPDLLDELTFLDNYEKKDLSDMDYTNIRKKIIRLESLIDKSKKNEYYQIMIKERKFDKA